MIEIYRGVFSKKFCDDIIHSHPISGKSELIAGPFVYGETSSLMQDPNIIYRVNDIVRPCLQNYLILFDLAVPLNAFINRDIGLAESTAGIPIHQDNSIINVNGEITFRPLILLAYLNDDFKGGQLVFGSQNRVISPKAGDLCIFPAHFGHRHFVLPSTAPRYTLRLEYKIDSTYWTLL